MASKTWSVLAWADPPAEQTELSLICPVCGTDAVLTVGVIPAKIIAAIGLNLIFDPASFKPDKNFLPDEIQCRHCRRIFGGKGGL